MNKSISKLGRWSSVVSLSTFISYTICFMIILMVNPTFKWTNVTNFVLYSNTHSQIFKYVAMAFMILFSLSFVIQLECLREKVDGINRFFARIATHFAIAFSILVSLNYFVQISAVRLQVATAQTDGISQLVQSNPISGISAVNMLGWTVFLGLSCLFASFAVSSGQIGKIIKYSLLSNSIMMLLSGVAYVFNITFITMLFMYLGLGAAIITESIAMCFYFKQ